MEVIQLFAFLALYISSSALKSVYGEDCDPPPFVKDGFIFGIHLKKYSEGSIVTYGCPESHEIQGNENSVCRNGKWNRIPLCVESVRCGDPETVEHATLVNHNQKEATYQCDKGYEFNGNSKATCNDGQWTDIPVCSRQDCGLPRKIDNADVIHSNSMTARYQCNRYYKLRGSNDVTCRNGQWDDPPTCIPPCTVSSIPAGYNLQLQKQTVYIPEDGSVQFPCKSRTYNYVARSYYGTGLCKNGEVIFTRCTPY